MKLKRIPIHHIEGHEKSTQQAWESVLGPLEAGVCIVDDVGVIQFVNEAYCHLFRQSKVALIGRNIHVAFHDNMIVESLRCRKKISGCLDWNVGAKRVTCDMTPMVSGGEFQGVIGMYRLEDQEDDHHVIQLSFGQKQIEKPNPFPWIVTGDQEMIQKLCKAKKAAKTEATILLRGESGVGKELVAKAIHDSSNRAQGPFVAVNCGALPENLIESELFGHEEGAFTGAVRKKIGRFEQAAGGTLFLDEIGDLPLPLQVKLLRVLQERSFERVGGIYPVKANVRVIAATHVNLEQLIDEGHFREDLYYRLNVVPIRLSSLRERPGDVERLVKFYGSQIAEEMDIPLPTIHENVFKALSAYHWPGNVRELRNTMERMMILSEGGFIDLVDVPPEISGVYTTMKSAQPSPGLINLNAVGRVASFEEYEKEIIAQALHQYGSFNAAGKVLGLTHKTVAAKARKYQLRE